MTTFGNLIVSFFRNYMAAEKGARPNTINSYATGIKLLLRFCCECLGVTFEKLDVASITHETILQFLDQLETTRDNVPKTRNQRLAVIKTFFRFLALNDPMLTEQCERICAIKAKSTEHKVIQTLEFDEVQAIVDTTDPSTLGGARDHALVLLIYNTGARVQELVDLKTSDLRLQDPLQVTLTGKGQKQRIVPLRDDTIKALQHYLNFRKAKHIVHERLFLNARRAPLCRFGVNHIVEKYRKLAVKQCPSLANKHITPHTFRHTTALHLIQSGVDITVVKEWLGHSDIKTTSLYIDINVKMKRQALEKIKPLTAQTEPLSKQPEWLDPNILNFLDQLAGKTILCGVVSS